MSGRVSSRIWLYALVGTVIIGGAIGVPSAIGRHGPGEAARQARRHLERKEYAPICKLLEHDDPAVVGQVAAEFYDLAAYPDSEELVGALGRNLSRFMTREGALECSVALSRMGKRGVDLLPALESLYLALDHPDREVRRSAASAACAIRDAKVLPLLKEVLSWRDAADLPAYLTKALANIESPDVYPLLYLCLERRSLQPSAKIALEDRLDIRLEGPPEPGEREVRRWIEVCERAREKK